MELLLKHQLSAGRYLVIVRLPDGTRLAGKMEPVAGEVRVSELIEKFGR